ncbi:hypothetical protein N7520_008451 [Penicillium odoratum]|uniref:uncharacterized protein n=1 Tax=Penicillium odoratum TaxID=1167516 RepID=UPI002546BBC3|nr:uncharacterized protein N7520_008451 [Penicillium odoratum]KAJ5761295.1 hypothetical protein N7520_008451 [Penicillium odoratum]
MRVTPVIAFTSLCLTQGVSATILTDCVNAINIISPRVFIENVQRQSCEAGCRPHPDHWDMFGKDTMRELVEDGASHLGIKEGKDAFINFLDSIFQEMRSKCGSKLANAHGCKDSPELDEAMRCVDDYSQLAKIRAAPRLLPYVTAERCRKVGEYFQSSELWEKSFPACGKNYVYHCHEL